MEVQVNVGRGDERWEMALEGYCQPGQWPEDDESRSRARARRGGTRDDEKSLSLREMRCRIVARRGLATYPERVAMFRWS